MTLYVHNTLTRQKEEFKPIDAKNVRFYACGPTVYNYAHIGNARPAVVFDLLARLLRHIYGKKHVRYTCNITDIDDKIINAAKLTGEPISAITGKFARIYDEDMAAIGVEKPDFQPRATEYVPQMLAMVDKLVKAGHAYVADGHVLFDVLSWPDYGRLSRHNRKDIIAGARVEVAPYKRDPADFILWKPSTSDQPGWDSPYGRGRPGWHLECSAMNEAINGNHFDIHVGGEDLIFPHHENEIAQSVCAHGGEKYVNYWMHNGHLMVEGQKMSKSVGNVLLVHDLVKRSFGEVIRFALLSTHYRKPFDWTEELLQQSKRTLDKYYGFLCVVKDIEADDSSVPQTFVEALSDDLNTPKALAELAVLAKNLSIAGTDAEKAVAKGALLAAGRLMGLLQQDVEKWFQGGGDDRIEGLIEERKVAKQNKDFSRADQIRQNLEKEGIILEDTPQGTRWKRK
ncbi:MAG: cysteine--tRNA ligase [Alphaproteobacteria bacterium]|nr:cysteine--tRNA ligase [Alphaproteobacteria bacterium]MCK5658319.1 cysteine--tRNA ligase [Alphaproteobacteria bacterium]